MFNSDDSFVFLGVRQWFKTPESKPLNFVTIGNAKKFENYDFIVGSDSSINLNLFQKGDSVNPTFELGMYNGRSSFSLVNLVKAK